MSRPADRVLAMVRDGRIDEAEGARLLAAMDPEAQSVPSGALSLRLVWNPFVRWGGETAAIVGLVAAACELGASRLGVRFDGFLDLHGSGIRGAVPLTKALADQLVAWPLGAIVLYGVARAFGARARRFVDYLGVVGLARVPSTVLAVPIVALSPTSVPQSGIALAAMVALALLSIAWQLTLLVFGYGNASGLRGPKAGLSLALAVVVAETLSKVCLSLLE